MALFITGFNDDEAYTLVIARRLALSYFDHPPLHQWLLHGFVALAGEGHFDRLPFWAMFVAANAPLFGLARRLFGREAGLWTVFVYNASAYFLVSPDGLIMPDTPLLLLLPTAGWAVAEALYGEPESWRRGLALWLAAGLALGLAGLAKYSAALMPLGLLGFFAASPRFRPWLADPRPYLGGLLGLAVFAPALIWNAQNGWVSLAFQSDRAAGRFVVDAAALRAFGEGLLAQVVSLSPWIAPAALMGLWRARRGGADSGERLLLWLALPPLLLFATIPFVGQRAIPHWFNSGWIFAFPLAGRWLSGRTPTALRLWSRVSGALAVLTIALYGLAVTLGPAALGLSGALGGRDPTRFAYDWRSPAEAKSWIGPNGQPPAFVVVDNWRAGGRLGVALGPSTPICAFTDDPRGFAFACDPVQFRGKDALIALPQESAARVLPELAPYFAALATAEAFPLGRGGRSERVLTLVRARSLRTRYPLPYGPFRTAP